MAFFAMALIFFLSGAPGKARGQNQENWRAICPRFQRLPGRCVGENGRPAMPLNLIFIGSENEIRQALVQAGWTRISLSAWRSFKEGLSQYESGRKITEFPPFDAYKVLGRTQDMNWSVTVRQIEARHHFRLWRTGLTDDRGRAVWWGSGNYDAAVRWRNLTHQPSPDMDKERGFVAGTLAASRWVRRLGLVSLPQIPRSGQDDHGYAFETDGRALLVEFQDAPRYAVSAR